MTQRQIRFLVLTILCGLLAGCDMIDESLKRRAVEERLTIIFEGIHRGLRDQRYEPQKSVCRFYRDVNMVPSQEELGIADDHFTAFLREKGLYPMIDSYEIREIELNDKGALATVIINGKEYQINVPDKARLTWVKTSHKDR